MTGILRIEGHAPLTEITPDRPQKLNAISDEVLEALEGAVAAFAAQRAMRVLLISATGRYFCAGAELSPDISPDVAGSTLDGRHPAARDCGVLDACPRRSGSPHLPDCFPRSKRCCNSLRPFR
ncbi:Enoyl-CoA hydratase/carnithine racemase [Variovorax sp. HW608]|uniref:enoyl-CoA hydratase/isomerase family protein n=1 Tax=Variovorax sp. HW608 TaxID=1034889 RepID=UPI0008200B2A|nr:enoyl-CoA hydratase/isomerase family protein [Variovorax sp. HW608]SCK10108.1 Enoyl-CoA hydratase/carnithine racemase [Variovorax sp. HW608]